MAERGWITVPAHIHGPAGIAFVQLALDTGATKTCIRPAILSNVGYELAAVGHAVEVITASTVEPSSELIVSSIGALGIERREIVLLTHDLPASIGVDGVLGLDFLRGCRILIDFAAGTIETINVPS